MDTKSLFIGVVIGSVLGAGLLHLYLKHQRKNIISAAMALFKDAPIPNNAVIVKGEKGKNGGGDAGDGIFWQNGFVIMPGRSAR